MKPIQTKIVLSFSLFVVFSILAGQAQYCVPNPTYGTQYDTYIDGVQLAEMANLGTGDPADTNYHYYQWDYNHRTNLNPGRTYNISITGGTYFSQMHYVAWIDYNQDGDFYDSGEKLGEEISTASGQVLALSFAVPTSALNGETRMRVRCVWNISDPDPCTDYSYGETEDYPVIISQFSKESTGFDHAGGSIGMYDYNGDHDFDFLTTDYAFSWTDTVVRFYRDLGSYFDEYYPMSAPLFPPSHSIKYLIEDLNNDNYPDIVLMGEDRDDDSPHTIVYTGYGASLTYLPTAIIELDRGNIGSADLNNDGLKDLILIGQDINEDPQTYIYKNLGNNFELVESDIGGLYDGVIECFDYDLDMDMDILISGRDNYGTKKTTIYRNDGDWNFTNIYARLPQINLDFVDLGDFDNDGDKDILMPTLEDFRVYRNDGDGSFKPIIIFDSYVGGTYRWADMNNDGLLDITCFQGSDFFIYLNNGDETFTQTTTFIPGMYDAVSYCIGDYNNDFKLDIFANADSISFYENHTSNSNLRPSAPTNLNAVTDRPDYYSVTLSWDPGSDDKTATSALTYNLRIGTTSNGSDIMSPTSTTSKLMLPRFGNVGSSTSWIINNLEPGTYYWSVQTIDNAFNASYFSSQGSFVITPPLSPSSFFANGNIIENISGFDYDTDGDQDILISYLQSTIVYEQTSPMTFSADTIGKNLGVYSIADLNLDNLPDLTISTADSVGYLINLGNKNFTKVFFDTIPTSNLVVRDFDNDGDPDILTHNTNFYIYVNDGSLNFDRITLPFTDDTLAVAKLTAADIDNDGDEDIIATGVLEGSYYFYGESPGKTVTYRNDGDLGFTELQELYPGLGPTKVNLSSFAIATMAPHIKCQDYNKDNYIDLLITGRDVYNNNYSIIYINDQAGNFNQLQNDIRPTAIATPNWMDFNADGDIDLILPKIGTNIDNLVYLNSGKNTFEGFGTRLDSVTNTFYTNLIDINGDLAQDIIYSLKFTMIDFYRFETYIDLNTGNLNFLAPKVPSGLTSTLDSLTVFLNWDRSLDENTGTDGSTYNLWIGTSPTAPDVVSPLADLSTGKQYFNKIGNCGTRNNYQLQNLPVGTYYWSVQAIDNGLNSSAWSPTQSFDVSSINVDILADTACAESPTIFTDNTAIVGDDDIVSWYWDFGDGTNSILQNPKHTYSSGGAYTVKLTVKSTLTVQTDSLEVTVLHRPQANFSAATVCHNTSTLFTDQSNTSNNTVTAYYWDFGDEGTENDIGSVTHLYAQPGEYSSQLIIEAANGCKDTVSHNTIVAENPMPVVSLPNIGSKQYNSQICENDSTLLAVNWNPAYSYQWQFEGGNLFGETDTILVIKDVEPGTYTYGIKVTNPLVNCIGTDNQVILIKNAPEVPIIESKNSVYTACEGDSVLLTTPILNENYSYHWILDGYEQPGDAPEFNAIEEGEYSLRIVTGDFCSSSSLNTIPLYFDPVPEIESISIVSEDSSFCYGTHITLSTTINPEYIYYWKRDGDSLDITTTNFLVVTQSGKYTIVAKNSFNCTSSSIPIDVKFYDKPPLYLKSDSIFVCPEETISLEPDIYYKQYQFQWLRNGVTLSGKTEPILSDKLKEGDYKLVCTNQGCDSISKEISVKYISEIEKPEMVVFGPNVWYIGCKNDSAGEYRWYYNGDLMADQTSYICMAGQNLGTYRLEISDGSECWVSSEDIEIPNNNYKSGYFPETSMELSISPNPSTGRFFILMEGGNAGSYTMDLIDISGKHIFSEHIIKKNFIEQIEMDLPLQPGIYVLKVSDKTHTWQTQVAIE